MGRYISHMVRLHILLPYPEVITNMKFVKVSPIPLELCAGTPIKSESPRVDDGAFITSTIDNYRRNTLSLEPWCNFTDNQVLFMNDIKLYHIH